MPLDEYEAGLARLYVLEADRERERLWQRRRRLAAGLGTDFGIDRDRHVVVDEAVAR
ncbi:hypothetical protein [Streptomyces sp. NPDC018693]|uniref:hypothetical protein n=1 Tax=unclassified Streptomyces TaxID=2593676 RepID=UPI00379EEA05